MTVDFRWFQTPQNPHLLNIVVVVMCCISVCNDMLGFSRGVLLKIRSLSF